MLIRYLSTLTDIHVSREYHNMSKGMLLRALIVKREKALWTIDNHNQGLIAKELGLSQSELSIIARLLRNKVQLISEDSNIAITSIAHIIFKDSSQAYIELSDNNIITNASDLTIAQREELLSDKYSFTI